MKIKVFEFSTSYWSWGWRVSPQDVERALAQWVSENPNVQIRDIKHTTMGGLWHPPQLLITIYFD
jgi:hypothetical protein